MEELIKVFDCKYFNINLYQIKNNDKYKITLIVKHNGSIYDKYFNYVSDYLQFKNVKRDNYTYDEVLKYIEIILDEKEFSKFIDSKVINKQKSLICDIDNIISKFNMNSSLEQPKEQPKEQLKEQIKEKPKVKVSKRTPKETPKETSKSKIEEPPKKQDKQTTKQTEGPIKINNSFIDLLFNDIDSFIQKNQAKTQNETSTSCSPSSQPFQSLKQTEKQPEKQPKEDDDEENELIKNKMKDCLEDFINTFNEQYGEKIDINDIHIIPINVDKLQTKLSQKTEPKTEQKPDQKPEQQKEDIAFKPLYFKPPTQKSNDGYYSTTQKVNRYKTDDNKVLEDKKISKESLEKLLEDALNMVM